MKVIITGGAGYIGSFVVKALLEAGHKVHVFDNLSMGHREAVTAGAGFDKVNLLDGGRLKSAIGAVRADAVIHLAGLIAVGESVERPGVYYSTNVSGSLNLLNACVEREVPYLVYSSTCAVYAPGQKQPLKETSLIDPVSPYARSKHMVELMLEDFNRAAGLNYISLRYFNAAGASEDGKMGESHNPESHLIPLVMEAACGNRRSVTVYGSDYDTLDGTCVRDYIHVEDLAKAHVLSLEYLSKGGRSCPINLGTGTGTSVRELIDKARDITALGIPVIKAQRRQGDVPVLISDNAEARQLLGWKPAESIDRILSTAYVWHKNRKY